MGTIRTLFNLMAMTGHMHKNLNISIIKPDISIVRQNVLIKNCLNINRLARTKTLFPSFKNRIDSFALLQAYGFFIKQMLSNPLTRDVYNFLEKKLTAFSKMSSVGSDCIKLMFDQRLLLCSLAFKVLNLSEILR